MSSHYILGVEDRKKSAGFKDSDVATIASKIASGEFDENSKSSNHLIPNSAWIAKLLQLHATQLVRHGIIVMGPSGAAKSSLISTLAQSLTNIQGVEHQNTKCWYLNPKSLESRELFGSLDAATGDWTDGTFTTLWRRTLKLKKEEFVWMVQDGPVDTIWIESLNSVLDDSKILTLPNGDRINMSPNVKLIFESDNIRNASPATVSRNGVIYVSESVVDWKDLLDAWLKDNESYQKEDICELFRLNFTNALNFGEQQLNYRMPVMNHFITKQALTIFKTTIDDNNSPNMEKNFVYSVLWSIGALCEVPDREKLVEFLSKDCKLDCAGYEYYPDSRGKWTKWTIPEYKIPALTTDVGVLGHTFNQIFLNQTQPLWKHPIKLSCGWFV